LKVRCVSIGDLLIAVLLIITGKIINTAIPD
jgi:hypothetical protein